MQSLPGRYHVLTMSPLLRDRSGVGYDLLGDLSVTPPRVHNPSMGYGPLRERTGAGYDLMGDLSMTPPIVHNPSMGYNPRRDPSAGPPRARNLFNITGQDQPSITSTPPLSSAKSITRALTQDKFTRETWQTLPKPRRPLNELVAENDWLVAAIKDLKAMIHVTDTKTRKDMQELLQLHAQLRATRHHLCTALEVFKHGARLHDEFASLQRPSLAR
eukprot:GEMP01013832.1.p1 GENE.GEMP01013832.1~~GEMP01013832.1.p1  ORF type:complete len:216 (+),score=38.35 GEMP01013832.1:66-713(+)